MRPTGFDVRGLDFAQALPEYLQEITLLPIRPEISRFVEDVYHFAIGRRPHQLTHVAVGETIIDLEQLLQSKPSVVRAAVQVI